MVLTTKTDNRVGPKGAFMFRPWIAALLVAAPYSAAYAQLEAPSTGSDARGIAAPSTGSDAWGIAAMPNGCMIQASSPQGTMLSIWGFAGDAKLGFLLQNRQWNALQDGRHYNLSVDFNGRQKRLVQATARENIDSDGPGYFFSVEPGANEGSNFLRSFTTARGMTISREGHAVDTLPLAGSQTAMAAFARCLSDHWQVPAADAGADDEDDNDAGSADPRT
jgi:hypothetical protein